MTAKIHRDPLTIESGIAVLQDMSDVCPSLVYAALLTDDGFEVVRLPDASTDGNRFASMASSMQALCDAVARELNMGSSQYIVIASDNGYVIQLRVPDHPIVLSALFGNDETVGKALSISRLAVSRMSEYLAPSLQP
jgi:predicted regulator of Ras-like GTPase activity (Roadblock/LC7/MglB family)